MLVIDEASVGFERLRDSICDGLNTVRSEADSAGSANALEMLHEKLDLVAMIAVTQEQRANASECFRHSEYVGASFTYVQEDFSWSAVDVVNCYIRHTK